MTVEKPNPPAPFPEREGGAGNLTSFSQGRGSIKSYLPLSGKVKYKILLPSPFRGGAGGGVKLIIDNGARSQI